MGRGGRRRPRAGGAVHGPARPGRAIALFFDENEERFVPGIGEAVNDERFAVEWEDEAEQDLAAACEAATPTSPGEAARLMPATCATADPEHRTRRLFPDAPAEALPWIGSWIGVGSEPGTDPDRYRQSLLAAPHRRLLTSSISTL